ncbi:hypothetical protein ACIBG8_16610 [Nonomuraea sp. NPDC050556]|uniref:hypothetical protein n=1 Tax=Nonomuraea sp. NPDC050556 TaxID=3364369 RepID=UPI0037A02729
MIMQRPAFALELLGLGLRASPDAYTDARCESVELNERRPVEYAADSVISVRGPDGGRRFVIVEMQNTYKEEKFWAWAAYVGGLMGRYRCPVMLVVICLDQADADKYRRRFLPDDSCIVLAIVVVGPSELPLLRDREDVLASPELATLAAVAHADLETAAAVADIVVTLGDERSSIYYSYLCMHLPESMRARLEALMAKSVYEYSDRFTQIFENRGRGASLVAVMGARGMELDDVHRAQVEACTDCDQLQQWIVRAATATSVEEIFGD